jgi:ferrochelatase
LSNSLPKPSNQILDEPGYRHGQAGRTGLLLVNLGTPDEPTSSALRRYLREFLSDPRVVEIPRFIWWPILNFIILLVRPAKSAAKYASIWLSNGSPLRVYSEEQTARLKDSLQASGRDVEVLLAMRYGQPSVPAQIQALKQRQVTRLVVLPMYPQFSATTTATVFDKVFDSFAALRNPPALRLIRSFAGHPSYIKAVAASIQRHWAEHGRGDLLLFSFHGVPKRTLLKGDPYHCECYKSARLIARQLGLEDHEWKLSFQSRFGRAEWLKPYTVETLEALPGQGIRRLDVACPGFVVDCLETLEEIAMEGQEEFLHAGGEHYAYINCINASDEAVAMLETLFLEEAQGWPLVAPDASEQRELEQARESALRLGAQD